MTAELLFPFNIVRKCFNQFEQFWDWDFSITSVTPNQFVRNVVVVETITIHKLTSYFSSEEKT